MATTQTAEKPNFDTVWAVLQELAASQKETDRAIKETMKDRDRQRQIDRDEFNKRLGSLTNLFGDFTLGMVAPKLRDKFREFGFDFLRTSPNPVFEDRKNSIFFEIDILLENGEKAMLVEVKTKLTKERINSHVERLEKMRKYADLHGDNRRFLGAVAGFAVTDDVRDFALQEGFYLIEPDGENFKIIPPGAKPREW